MPDYEIQTQRKIITTDRTALFISNWLNVNNKENKEETIRDKGREEKR